MQYSVGFAISGANVNPYSDSIEAEPYGSYYRGSLLTSGLLGEYKVQTVINSAAAGSYDCPGSVNFFNVITGASPTLPVAAKCASMTGTWTDAASGQATFYWSLAGTNGSISGHATVNDAACNNETITLSTVTGSYDPSTLTYSLDGKNSSTDSCGRVAYEQQLSGSINAKACGLGSGTFNAVGHVSGSNTMTVSERIPTGESSSVAPTSSSPSGWADQYGWPTTAEFNANLQSGSGYNFGGRVATENPGSASQGYDSCTYPGAPWDPMLTLNVKPPYPSWNIQSAGQNGSYGPDSVGLTSDQVAYIQNKSWTFTQSGCSVEYPQIMVINQETATSGNDPSYANNYLTFNVTPSSVSVQRANTPTTRTFHF